MTVFHQINSYKINIYFYLKSSLKCKRKILIEISTDDEYSQTTLP